MLLGRIFRQPGLLLISFLILGAAAFTLVLDLRSEQLNQLSPSEAVEALAEKVFPLSERGYQSVAEACHRTFDSMYFKALPTVRRNQVLETCRETLSELAHKVPTNGLVRLVLAEVAGLEAAENFGELLLNSAKLAPNSTWLRLRRTAISFENQAALDDNGRVLERDDIELLLRSPLGLRNLASQYLSNPVTGMMIVAMLDDSSPEIQRAFVAAVQAAQAAE